ncbi:MAG TPA: L,D-transpeptidase [Acidobacteriota bacterium]|nr:L,D-transpeptidase [Acidobacteriota bacterium]
MTLLAFLLLSFAAQSGQPVEPTEDHRSRQELEKTLQIIAQRDYPEHDLRRFLFVSVARQRMYLVEEGRVRRTFTVSTSKNGVGNLKGSEKTPPGLHEVCAKHGDDVPLGGIFKGRVYTGEQAEILQDGTDLDSDDVTTRVLRLCGREPGRNKGGRVDTFQRMVYIHGTPEEGLLGRPASDGCVRMKNSEVIKLYEMVEVGIPVLILEL